jgi:hypothetical protein
VVADVAVSVGEVSRRLAPRGRIRSRCSAVEIVGQAAAAKEPHVNAVVSPSGGVHAAAVVAEFRTRCYDRSLDPAACVVVRCVRTLLAKSFAGLLAADIHLAFVGCVESELGAGSGLVNGFYDVNFTCTDTLAIMHHHTLDSID